MLAAEVAHRPPARLIAPDDLIAKLFFPEYIIAQEARMSHRTPVYMQKERAAASQELAGQVDHFAQKREILFPACLHKIVKSRQIDISLACAPAVFPYTHAIGKMLSGKIGRIDIDALNFTIVFAQVKLKRVAHDQPAPGAGRIHPFLFTAGALPHHALFLLLIHADMSGCQFIMLCFA
ncbi:hypothetical protein SDC9_190031 [bioreactor metagenome]|uniref:Uncharacterized protein n=1 Tax=bioreactor metagenome TaxID=1076179 RepID=A0A645I1Y5_9ZZZZ